MNKHLIAVITITCSLSANPAYAVLGETWELTTKTEVAGMAAPLEDTTITVCMQKGAEKNTSHMVIEQDGCKNTDIKTSGNRITWKLSCDRDGEVLTGSGEVTYTSNSYQGSFKQSGKSHGRLMNTTYSYNGKRIGAACDPDRVQAAPANGMGNMNEMMGLANKQMASAMAEQCEVSNYSAVELISNRFFGPQAACSGKEKFACQVISKDVARKAKVYIKLAKHDDTSEVAIAQICRIDMPAATQAICKTVDANNYQELADYCPTEAKAFDHASRSDTGTPSANSPVDSSKSVIDTAKKLKGLFGY